MSVREEHDDDGTNETTVHHLVESALSFLSQLPSPSIRSDFYHALGSRLLELSTTGDHPHVEDEASRSSSLPDLPSSSSSDSDGPPSPKRPRWSLHSPSSSNLLHPSNEPTFDGLPPDVIVSHIFRFFEGMFSPISSSEDRFGFSLKVGDYSMVDGHPLDKLEPDYNNFTTYFWNVDDRKERNVKCLWGYFSRDVFRHPWFLFECLELLQSVPTHKTNLVDIISGFKSRFVPRIVISTKMLFSLSVKRPNDVYTASMLSQLLAPKTRNETTSNNGFIHLHRLAGSLQSSEWIDQIPIETDRPNIQILDLYDALMDPTDRIIERIKHWKGHSLMVYSNSLDVIKEMTEWNWDHLRCFKGGFSERTTLAPICNGMTELRELSLSPLVSKDDPFNDFHRDPFLKFNRMKIWCGSLEKLSVHRLQLTWRHVLNGSLENLRVLSIIDCDCDDEIFRMNALSRLEDLTIRNLRENASPGWEMSDSTKTINYASESEWIFDPRRSLKRLRLSRVSVPMVDFFLQRGSCLCRLTLQNCYESSTLSGVISTGTAGGWDLSSLTHLKLDGSYFKNETAIAVVPSRLEKLFVSNKENSPGFLVPLLHSSAFRLVKELDLRGSHNSVLRIIATTKNEFPHLRSLRLYQRQTKVGRANSFPWFAGLIHHCDRFVQRIQIRVLRKLMADLEELAASMLRERGRLGRVLELSTQLAGETGIESEDWMKLDLRGFCGFSNAAGVISLGVGKCEQRMKSNNSALFGLWDFLRNVKEANRLSSNAQDLEEAFSTFSEVLSAVGLMTDELQNLRTILGKRKSVGGYAEC